VNGHPLEPRPGGDAPERAGTSLATRWVRFADQRRRALLLLCAALAALGLVGTVRLYGDLRPDLSELLPARSRSALDLATVTRRVGGYAEASVILHGADAATLELYADDLAEELQKAPLGLVKWVEYRVDAATDFYRRRALLFLTEAELRELRDTLAARIAWERALAAQRPPGPPPDLEGLVERLGSGQRDLLGRWRDGYYLGEVPGRRPGQTLTALAMLVRLGGDPGDYAQVQRLDRFIRAAVATVDPKKYAPTLQVAQGGFVASSILEHDALAEDLVWATLLVILAVAAAIAIYNRTWKAMPAVGLPLLAGTFVTFGLAWLLVGHLNSNTAFLGSIVVGNGINVGLIFFARYLEERRHGREPLLAMEIAVDRTWLATLTAALAAGVSYASLLSTDFRGFNQFGLIGGIGMALAWLFAYLMMPPLVLEWERHGPMVKPGQRPANPIFTHLVSRAVEGAPRLTVALSAVASIVAAGYVVHFARDPLEYDFTKLRDLSALREGAPGWWDERVDVIFGNHLTPAVLLGRDEAEAREIALRLEAHRRATPGTTLGAVLSVAALVPDRQEAKLPLLREIRALAGGDGLRFLPPDRRMAVEAILPPADLAPFGSADLPVELRRQLTEVDGRVGTPVLVYPAAAMDVWNGRDVLRHAEELRSIPMPRADVPMASSMLVFADVLAAIQQDGPRATWLSLAGVVALVLVAFWTGQRRLGSLSHAGWVLASLGVGVLWFGGLAGAFHLRLNMLNFIALPITFGIGVDYAVNVFQRRRLDPGHSIAECVRTTGGAVALCSVTTMIGYSSLLIARNQALISFGLLADLGEVACLAAALFALPAWLRWRELRLEARGG
jgi:predicted RND superfamily exporter protein